MFAGSSHHPSLKKATEKETSQKKKFCSCVIVGGHGIFVLFLNTGVARSV